MEFDRYLKNIQFTKMKKPLILICLLSGFVISGINAQSRTAAIAFNETSFNFGDMQESGGTKVHKFEFANTGGEVLIIQNVSTSCGCTTPEWTKEPVKPGQKGYVSAAYDPSGRPGPFEKYINVQSNGQPPLVKLTIVGRVAQKPLAIEDEYRFPFGAIRLKENHLAFGTVFTGQMQVKQVEMINTSAQPQVVKIENIPAHLSAKVTPSTLGPNQTGIIEITYNSSKKNDWGFIVDRMNISLNGKIDNSTLLLVSANLEENFAGITPEEKANAPKVSFEQNTFDFGKIKQSESVSFEYKFTNTGKSNLMIRKISPACGCTAVITSSDVIPAGGTGTLKTTFNGAGKLGLQNKTITVITNDPLNPKIILWVKGEVSE